MQGSWWGGLQDSACGLQRSTRLRGRRERRGFTHWAICVRMAASVYSVYIHICLGISKQRGEHSGEDDSRCVSKSNNEWKYVETETKSVRSTA